MATGTIKDPFVVTSTQTLTKTQSGQTVTGKFERVGNIVAVSIKSTGLVTNTIIDWQTWFTGLNSEFIPDEDVITGISVSSSDVKLITKGVRVYGKNSSNAGTVGMNIANASVWIEGYFMYIVN